MALTLSCGPSSAAIIAIWEKALAHETLFTASFVTPSTRGCGKTP